MPHNRSKIYYFTNLFFHKNYLQNECNAIIAMSRISAKIQQK